MARREAASTAAVSLREVYDEHHRFVWRILLRLGVPDAAADDAVQDVFVVVARRLDEFEARSSLRTWLFSIAKHVALHHRRASYRHERRKEALADEPEQPPQDVYARGDASRTLHKLLDALDEGQREVFVLAELEGMTAPEISRMLGLKQPTVYSRWRSARIKLEQAAARLRASEGERAR